MKTLFTQTKVKTFKEFVFLGLFMISAIFVNPLKAQNSEQLLSGVVSSLDGPVIGASIALKGTAITVISDENGAFTFPQELKKDDILVVSYLGYETDEITITANTTFIKPFLEDIAIVIVAALRTKT